MAFKKTLVQRLFNLSRFSTPTTTTALSKSSSPTKPPRPDPGEAKRAGQRRRISQSAMLSPAPAGIRLFPPEKLSEKLRGMDNARDRIRLAGGLLPFPGEREQQPREDHVGVSVTVSDVRKVLRASQVEMIRSKLRDVGKDWVTYNEFVEICKRCCGGNGEQALGFARTLDESGSVIVLGNAVCLRPHQVAKAIQSLVSPSLTNPYDPRREELEMMEEQKTEIDRKADSLVRRELWAGLGYLVVQTAAFMRLTFWELSWDVMEPICFYVTSAYFMAGYAFFLRTSKEPSFEGFFQSRFSAKQKRLMEAQNFDLERYNQLRKAFYPSMDEAKMIKFDDHPKID